MSRRDRRRAGEPLRVPEALLDALEGLHGPLAAPATVARLARGVAALQVGLTRDRARFAGGAYLEDPALRAAYQTYYLCANAPKLWPALDQLAPRLPDPLRVIELGGGPGTGLAGVGLWARARGRGVRHHLTDHRPANLAAASALARALDLPVETSRLDLTAPPARAEARYDLVLLMNVVNELPPEADPTVLAHLEALAGPTGEVLVIEPAAAEASRRALALRDALAAAGWQPRFPCPHALPCPARAAGDWCHAAWAFERPAFMAAVDAAVGTRRDLLQATWFAFGRAGASAAPGHRARIIAEPRREKGRTRAWICLDAGQRVQLELQRRDRAPGNAAFEEAGLHAHLRFDRAEAVGDGLRLGADATVEVTP